MPNIKMMVSKTPISFRCFDTGNSAGSPQWLMDCAFVYQYQSVVLNSICICNNIQNSCWHIYFRLRLASLLPACMHFFHSSCLCVPCGRHWPV